MERPKTNPARTRQPERSDLTDATLVERVLSGAGDAYGDLIDRYQAVVYRRCYQMTGNTPDAEELAHQTFVRAYIKLAQLRDPDKFHAWLGAVCLNVCRMWYRERQRQPEPLTDDTGAPQESFETDTTAIALVPWALSKLSEQHRVILVLRYFERLSYEDISRFLGLPLGTTMSRIHRAHRALKEIMNNPTDETDMDTLASREDFRSEIEAEIAVLLELSGADTSAMERLAIILRRSPERLGQILADAPTASTIENLARILPHLGSSAIDLALQLALTSTDAPKSVACAVLTRLIALSRTPFPCSSTPGGMAPRQVYAVVDRLIALAAPPRDKVALLANLMAAAPMDGVSTLLSVTLLCYPDDAYTVLSKRFWTRGRADEPRYWADVLYTLCRTGRRFCDSVIQQLHKGSDEPVLLALECAKAIGRALEMGQTVHGATAVHVADAVRSRMKWAPLTLSSLGTDGYSRLVCAVGRYLTHSRADLREQALEAARRLRAQALRPQIEECAAHPDRVTRCAAILALGDLGDASCVTLLLNAALRGEVRERLAAIQALAHLQAVEAAPALKEMLQDPNGEVRCAAVLALNDVDRENAPQVLRPLLGSSDGPLRKAAARALHGAARPGRTPTALEAERHRRAGTGGGAFTYRALDAAIRFAFPEIRSYSHQEITQRISRVCVDYSSARRHLIGEGLAHRENDVYALTALGETVWRVERFILERYLGVGLLAAQAPEPCESAIE